MLDSTPIHLAYSKPFYQHVRLEEGDVSADVIMQKPTENREVMEINYKFEMSHLILVNILLNFLTMIITMVYIGRK